MRSVFLDAFDTIKRAVSFALEDKHVVNEHHYALSVYIILAFILDNQLDNAKPANGIFPEFHFSEIWILAKSCLL